MKTKKRTWIAALVLVFVLASSTTALADTAVSDTNRTSTAKISITSGTIRLTQAPDINFGSRPLANTAQTYTAQTVDGCLSVDDARNLADGWNVTVTLGNFHLDGQSASTLLGSQLAIGTGAITKSGVPGTVTPTTPITLTAGDTARQKVVSQTYTGNEYGVWDVAWAPANISLLTTAETPGDHVAELNWMLEVGP